MRAQLASVALPVRLVAGHNLYEEGDAADSFYVLQEGKKGAPRPAVLVAKRVAREPGTALTACGVSQLSCSQRCGSRPAAVAAPVLNLLASLRRAPAAAPAAAPALPWCRGSHQPAGRPRGGPPPRPRGGGPGSGVQSLCGRLPQQAAHRQATLLQSPWPSACWSTMDQPTCAIQLALQHRPVTQCADSCFPLCPALALHPPPLQCGQRPTAPCGSSAAPTWPRCSSTAPPSCRPSAAATCRRAPCPPHGGCRRCRCPDLPLSTGVGGPPQSTLGCCIPSR